MINRWRHLGRNTQIMAVALVAWAMGEGLWVYLQPLYFASLGAGPRQIGFILAASGLARLLVMVPAGLLADRFGAWPMLFPGWILGILGTLILALAPNITTAGLGLVVYGISAMAIPVINLYLVESIKADETAAGHLSPQEVLTFIHALFWIGIIISPVIGGWVADNFSYRVVFGLSALWFTLSTVIMARTKPYTRPERQETLTQTNRASYFKLLGQSQLLAIFGIFGLSFIATILGTSLAPKYLEDVHHLSDTEIGLLGSVLALGAVIWNLQLGRARPWAGFIVSLTLSGLAFAVLTLTGQLWVLIIAYFMLGAWDILRPVATSIASDYTPPALRGAAFGLVDSLHGLGAFIAPASAGMLYASQPHLPFWVGAGLMPIIVGFVALFLIWQRRQYTLISPLTPELTPERDSLA